MMISAVRNISIFGLPAGWSSVYYRLWRNYLDSQNVIFHFYTANCYPESRVIIQSFTVYSLVELQVAYALVVEGPPIPVCPGWSQLPPVASM